MTDLNLEGVELIRVIRAAANCRVTGTDAVKPSIICKPPPHIRRDGATLEVDFQGNAQLEVPAGVALEIAECAGNLAVKDYAGNLAVGRVHGNLHASGIGSIAIREEVGGNLTIEGAKAVEARSVRGNLNVADAAGMKLGRVGGSAYLIAVEGDVAIERSGGKCRAEQIRGALSVGQVGGKLHAESIAGALAVGRIGGHASIRAIAGDVDLPEIGGAAILRGSYQGGHTWRIRCRGRLTAELPANASVAIEASARRGSVRTRGIEGDLRWDGERRLSARIGTGACKLDLESGVGDIVVEAEGMAESGRGWHCGWYGAQSIAEPLEDLAGSLGEEISRMVGGAMGAAGRFASDAGLMSGDIVEEVARGVSKGLRHVERGLSDLERAFPEDLPDKLSEVGREINSLVRDAIRRARERREDRAHGANTAQTSGAAERAAGGGASEAHMESGAAPAGTEAEIRKILEAVKEGRIEPAEADELIAALLELERADARPDQR